MNAFNDHIKKNLTQAIEICLDDYKTVLECHHYDNDAMNLSSESSKETKKIADKHKEAKIILTHLDMLIRLTVDDKNTPSSPINENVDALISQARKALKEKA